jgi:hypothetical protein
MTSRPIATARGALSAPTGRPTAAAYGALSALSLINRFNYADRYLLAGALPLVQREFGGTDAQMGVLSASFLVVSSAVSPLTGLLGDRVARTWLVGGGALNAALLNVAPPTMRASAVALHPFVTHAFGDALAPALLGALGDVISLPYALAFNAGAVALAGAIFWLGRAALRADLGPAAPPPAPPQTGR